MVLAEPNHYIRSTEHLILFANRVELFVRRVKPDRAKSKAQHYFNRQNKHKGHYCAPVHQNGVEAWLRHSRTNYDQIWRENQLHWFSNEQQKAVKEVLHQRVKELLQEKGLL